MTEARKLNAAVAREKRLQEAAARLGLPRRPPRNVDNTTDAKPFSSKFESKKHVTRPSAKFFADKVADFERTLQMHNEDSDSDRTSPIDPTMNRVHAATKQAKAKHKISRWKHVSAAEQFIARLKSIDHGTDDQNQPNPGTSLVQRVSSIMQLKRLKSKKARAEQESLQWLKLQKERRDRQANPLPFSRKKREDRRAYSAPAMPPVFRETAVLASSPSISSGDTTKGTMPNPVIMSETEKLLAVSDTFHNLCRRSFFVSS